MLKRSLQATCLAAALALAAGASADQVTIGAMKDNTMYVGFATNTQSSGAGPSMFTGVVGLGFERRSLIAFDVAGNVPAGATINSVTLMLEMDKTISADSDVSLHLVTADWGEGTSLPDGGVGGGGGGAGGDPTDGDATWEHTFYPDAFWTNVGGDFVAAPSATTSVGGPNVYTWGSTAAMVAETQAWLDLPATNYGWLLLGDESMVPTAKRFISREGTSGQVPMLTIDFTPSVTCMGDFDGDGMIGFSDLTSLLGVWGPCPGCPEDLTGDGDVGFADLTTLLGLWGPCPGE